MSSNSAIDASTIPKALRTRRQWICWKNARRDGKPTKVPVIPRTGDYASSTDSETWREFETALAAVETERVDGIGFVFTEADDFVGVDLDTCRDPKTGEINDVARAIIDRLDSYTEVSPSGTGFHVLVRGTLPEGRNRRGSLELYETARFFTVTGEPVPGMPTRIASREDALAAVHREYVQTAGSNDEPECDTETADSEETRTPTAVALSDDDLLSKARTASNGAKFERLWAGTTAGYDSHSEADMALCCLLAFWTGGDESRIDRLFRQSNLYRGKWNDVHYADGSTYGERTVERAIAMTSEFYEHDAGRETSNTASDTVERKNVNCQVEPDRNVVYLAEQNRLLIERLAELETTVERKSERIETLKAQLKRRKVV